MTERIRRLIVAVALMLPPAFAACSKSAAAPKIAAVIVQPYAGQAQAGLAGWAVNFRPAVRVTDSTGSAVFGAAVSFAVAGGGGTATNLTATTDANGVAQVGSWTLGASPGVNTMTATVTATGHVPAQLTFADTGYAAGYTITIQKFGPAFPAAAQAAFDSAAAKWARIIYRPLSAVQLNFPASDTMCSGIPTPAVSTTTSGVVILASVDSIDGPGKTLAEATPCRIRSSNGLTVVGIMKFDSADVTTLSSATLAFVVLHEMNHVLGFGTLWSFGPFSFLQIPSNPPGTILDTYFSGPKANAAFDSSGGLAYSGAANNPPVGNHAVPVEDCGTSPYVSPTCGAGTVNSHWRKVVFGNELMTGYISSGANPLTIVSVAADADLGYVVNYAAADQASWTRNFAAPPAVEAARVWIGNDVLRIPIGVVDASGRTVRTIRPR